MVGLDTYELDRLLASLNLHNHSGGSGGRRRNREQRQSARMATGSSSVSGDWCGAAGRAPDHLDAHIAASAVAREQRGEGGSGAVPAELRSLESRAGLGGGRARDSFPASWPPAGSLQLQCEVC